MIRLLRRMLRPHADDYGPCLAPFPHAGPTPDWTGPQTPLAKNCPVAALVCGLFEWASERKATKIRLNLDKVKGHAKLSMKNSHDWEHMPGIGEDMWSHLVLFLPQISSIESLQGVIKDPATEDEWRFNFTKENNQIVLSKIESVVTNENL